MVMAPPSIVGVLRCGDLPCFGAEGGGNSLWSEKTVRLDGGPGNKTASSSGCKSRLLQAQLLVFQIVGVVMCRFLSSVVVSVEFLSIPPDTSRNRDRSRMDPC